MWLPKYERGILVLMILVYYDEGLCQAISNTQFNASLRDYATDDNFNSTDVRTLQKDLSVRYAQQAPATSVIRFKEVPDSVLSGSSHGRGLLHLGHHGNGYGLSDYEESPHYAYEYHYPEDHHGHYDSHHDSHDDHHGDHHGHYDDHHSNHHGHHVGYHDDHKHGYGHHHKHYDHHALAAKTVLWPIAGIALLGAAAALVTNPVLLQLGVVSGRRRRRDTEEITDNSDPPKNKPDYESILRNLKNFNKTDELITRQKRNNHGNSRAKSDVKNIVSRKDYNNNHRLLFAHVNAPIKGIQLNNANTDFNRHSEDKHYIPIPLMNKKNVSN